MIYRFALVVFGMLVLAACSTAPAASPAVTAPAAAVKTTAADLSGIKTYTAQRATALKAATTRLKTAADHYYDLAKAANFDYAALWKSQATEVTRTIEEARAAWVAASPLYEQMEGIVAGVESLADYDVSLDSGASAEEGGDKVVSFDLTLPNGKTIVKPGNLFGVTESTLWGTFDDFTVKAVHPDYNGNGQVDFGEILPDANVLKAGVDALADESDKLLQAIQEWTPSETDAFTALVVMVPTMSEYFESWKNSRFVAGDATTQRDFVAISRLADIADIVTGLQVVYQGVSPRVRSVDPAQDTAISQGLEGLKKVAGDVLHKEKGGQRFKPEEADLLGAEAQNRATALTGQIAQVAARLQVQVK